MNSSVFASFSRLACGCQGSVQEEIMYVDARSSITRESRESSTSEESNSVPSFFDFSERPLGDFSETLRSMTLNSRQATQNAVEKFMARITTICETSALDEEDGASINLDALVDFVWPDVFFEGLEKNLFCRRRYNSVTTAHDRLMDTLDPAERERLVIILSLKDRISHELQKLGFVELHELQAAGCMERTSYELQLRRFNDSGPGRASWLHLNWSVAERGCSPQADDLTPDVDDTPDVEHIPMGPRDATPRGATSSRASTHDVVCDSALSSSTAADRHYIFLV